MIIEILSPSASKKDLNEKFQLYEKHGVKEYCIMDPGNKYIQVFHLLDDGKNSGKYDDGTLIPPANWREDKNHIAESVFLHSILSYLRLPGRKQASLVATSLLLG